MNNELKRTVDVGGYVSPAYFEKHREAYEEMFPDIQSSFEVDVALIKRVLAVSTECKGIRFMYGLSDARNPQSTRLLLVPCSSRSEYCESTYALISDRGYYDHQGTAHTITETCGLIASFVQHVKTQHPELAYKSITRGGFIGKNSIGDLVNSCSSDRIVIHMGYKKDKDVTNLFFESETGEKGPYMDFILPCPNACDESVETESEECLASMAARLCSSEIDLDVHRAFRDHQLLKMEGGPMFFELYYFISPMISHIVSTSHDQEEVLRNLYTLRIDPFNQCLRQKDYQGALEILESTLQEWVATYQVVDFEYS